MLRSSRSGSPPSPLLATLHIILAHMAKHTLRRCGTVARSGSAAASDARVANCEVVSTGRHNADQRSNAQTLTSRRPPRDRGVRAAPSTAVDGEAATAAWSGEVPHHAFGSLTPWS
eukprot:1278623-Prymnesium_polylepis.3